MPKFVFTKIEKTKEREKLLRNFSLVILRDLFSNNRFKSLLGNSVIYPL